MDKHEDDAAQGPQAAVGDRLRAAREAAGLSREDIAARTKIAERHIVAIEEDRFSDLAARTYAIGFSRAYARHVGLDEGEIADAVRHQLDVDENPYPQLAPDGFEPGDPARVPSARLAWSVAIVGVLAVIVLLVLFWPSFLSPSGSLPDLLQVEEQASSAPASGPAAGKEAPSGGEVVFTSREPRVWVKFYDAAGNQLFQKEMSEGERYAVPADAEGPLLWTARPDALDITVGGKPIAKLSDKPVTVKDVPVDAASLLGLGSDESAGSEKAAPRAASRQTATAPQPAADASAQPRPAPRSEPSRQAARAASGDPAAGEGSGTAATAPAVKPATAVPPAAPAAPPAAPKPKPVAPAPAEVPAPAPAPEAVSTVPAADSTVSE